MSKAYALTQLLMLGPLSLAAMLEITGWPYAKLRQTVNTLRENQTIHYCPYLGAYLIKQVQS